jgi:hypothetical protein
VLCTVDMGPSLPGQRHCVGLCLAKTRIIRHPTRQHGVILECIEGCSIDGEGLACHAVTCRAAETVRSCVLRTACHAKAQRGGLAAA